MSGRVPRVYRAEAVVLRAQRLSDADRVLTLFAAQYGKFDAVAKGVRRQTSRKAGHLEPLTLTSLLLAHGRTLDLITDAQTIESFLPLREEIERLARGLYVAELVDRFHAERAENYPAFRLLVETLEQLASAEALDLVVRRFELLLLVHTGFAPRLDRCVACDAARTQPDSLPLSVNALKVLRFLRQASVTEALKLHLPPRLNAELETLLRGCIRAVLEGAPRSAAFIDDLRAGAGSSPRPRDVLA